MEETAPIDPSVTSGEDVTASTTTRSNRVISKNYATFLQQRGAELARFLAWFIDNEKIPPRSDEAGRASGGISLLGWSLGNVTTLSTLAFSSTLDPELMKKLEPYLRKVIIFGKRHDLIVTGIVNSSRIHVLDPANDTLGYPTPAHWYNPRSDPEISAEELRSKSMIWLSSYFAHSPSSRDPIMLMHDFMKGNLAQHEIHPSKKPTVMSPTDISAGEEVISTGHGDLFSVRESARAVHETVRIRALFSDLNQTSGPPVLPKVDISYIWCTESIWQAVFTMRSLQQDIASPPDHHYLARSVRFMALEGGNHFVSNKILIIIH